MQQDDIGKLANLARIDMTEDELAEIAKSFDSILAYVGQIQEVSKLKNTGSIRHKEEDYFLHNIMRDDTVTNRRGECRDKLIAEMPDTQGDYLKVKQIL